MSITRIVAKVKNTVKSYFTSINKSRGCVLNPITIYVKHCTLVKAHKRQRVILHVTAGDGDWEPTTSELDSLVSLFQKAELNHPV